MMIDEADEFVAGPQSKKRGNPTETNSGAAPKRRRSMSPLLRRPQTPPIISNHVLGKGTTVVPGQHGLIKPIPLHKGEHYKDQMSKVFHSILSKRLAINSDFLFLFNRHGTVKLNKFPLNA